MTSQDAAAQTFSETSQGEVGPLTLVDKHLVRPPSVGHRPLWPGSTETVMGNKITINLTAKDQDRLADLKRHFPFASLHALVQLLMREGLDAGPERLVSRLERERAEGLRP